MTHIESHLTEGVHELRLALVALCRCSLTAHAEDHLWEEAVDLLRGAAHADCVAAFRRCDDGSGLEVLAGAGLSDKLIGRCLVPTGSGTVTESALHEDRPLAIDDVSAETRFAPSPIAVEHGFNSGISVAVTVEGRPWGVCEFHWREPGGVSEEVHEFIGAVTAVICEALGRIERDRQHQWVLESVAEALVVAQPDKTINGVNRALCELTGRRRKELVGRSFEELFVESCRGRLDAKLRREGRARERLRVERGDGGEVVVEVFASHFDHHILLVFSDVTEMARTEQEYRKFYLLVEHARDLIGLAELDGRVTYLNPAGCRLVGLEPGQAAGMTTEEFLPPHERERFFDQILPRVVDEGSWTGRVDVRDFQRDDLHQTDATLVVLRDPSTGEPIGYANVMRDVSEQLRLRDQLRQSQKMEALGLLASGVAHDFNNHLTVIKGYSELLLDDLDRADPRRPQLAKIEQVSNKAQRLTDQLLTFSRRKVRQPRVLDLNEVLASLQDMLRSLIGEQIALNCATSEEPQYIEIDPSDVEQVVLNLAVNARDAIAETGTITVRSRPARAVELTALQEHPELGARPVVLEVRDTGAGIEPALMEHLFEPFFTTKEPSKGTGLGLATVQRIVSEAGGEIRVTSRPGWGTCFDLFFPRAEPPHHDQPAAEPVDQTLEGNEVVLVVEDNADVRDFIVDLLQRHGYDSMACADGQAALELLEMYHDSIDAVIFDMVVPHLSTQELRELIVERYAHIPVVLTSGYADYEQFRADPLLSDLPFVAKPTGARELLGQLRRVLD